MVANITARIRAPSLRAQIYRATLEGGEPYGGVYTAVPGRDAQTFETGSKTMTQNFKVEGVPFYEVSNRDGVTIIIGD